MRICLMIEGQEGVTWEQWSALAAACEEQGFDALFRSDHYTSFGSPSEKGALDAWSTLNALAATTTRLRLGTLVSPVTFRHPSVLAKSVVTADHVSGGRIELGMGAGWFEREHRAWGFDFPSSGERLSLLAEQVEIVHRLLDHREAVVDFSGTHYRLDRADAIPKPVQEPHPPLVMGGNAGPRAAALAARWADEYNSHGIEPDEVLRRRERLARACHEVERDPETLPFSLMTPSLVGADDADLAERAARMMERQGQTGDPAAWLAALDYPWLAGTPDRVLEKLAEYSKAGVSRIMLQHHLHEDLEQLATIGLDIIPEAAGL